MDEPIIVGFFVLVAAVIYFLPWMLAHKSRHPYRAAIFVLNLFLGWTFIGWVASLTWAFAKPQY